MANIIPHPVEVKRLLRKQKLVETYFVAKYGFSPYGACQHACQYCDGRAEKYYVEGDFERDIVIRRNAPQLLEYELTRLREPGTIMIGSGISDAYQPVEVEERLMRTCAEVLSQHDFSVMVLTKSSLIKRDLDVWQMVNQRGGFTLMMSLTMLDDGLRRLFEPGASSTKARLETLRRFKEAGFTIGVAAMPFLPHLADSAEAVTELVQTLADIGVDFVMPGGLTLRPGRQKETYMTVIRSHFPQLVDDYHTLYGENRPSGSPQFAYRQEKYLMFMEILNSFRLPMMMPHRVYRERFALYDEIHILLSHMADLYALRGVDTRRLNRSRKRYTEWLTAEKTIFNRRRKVSYHELESQVKTMIRDGEMERILDNRKLAEFVQEIALEDTVFDYNSLKVADQSSG